MKVISKLISRYSIALVLSVASFYSPLSIATDYSELKAYEIEVIIFSFNQTESAGSEIWPDLVKTANVENAIELHDNNDIKQIPGPDKPAYYYSKIKSDDFRLRKEVEKLTASKKVNVIYHSAWIQPGLDKESAEFIHIESSQTDENISIVDPLNTVSGNYPTQPSLLLSQQNNMQAEEEALLEGVIKVELGRYLHIYFDLKYRRDIAPQHGVVNTTTKSLKDIKYYPIQMHRRMRSKEVHFIDHPLLGILVLATPFELPEEAEEPYTAPLYKLDNVPVTE